MVKAKNAVILVNSVLDSLDPSKYIASLVFNESTRKITCRLHEKCDYSTTVIIAETFRSKSTKVTGRSSMHKRVLDSHGSLHNIAAALLALLQIGFILCNAQKFEGLVLHALHLDVLLALAMPPPQALDGA